MQYTSTRSAAFEPSARAIASGIAPDGGLYTPVSIPRLPDLRGLLDLSYSELAARILGLYLTDFTPEELGEYARAAYNTGRFLIPGTNVRKAVGMKELRKGEDILQLYFGPTAAFKDMALQIMPRLLTASVKKLGEERTVCILVATSGDTGKAALEGFRDVNGTRIGVFFPDKGVSEIQRTQMETQDGGNVCVWAVKGNFDDTQTGVKRIFTSPEAIEKINGAGCVLSSANSINWGRLAPQIVYYVWAYLCMARDGKMLLGDKIDVCVPTGNFGNILAAYFARRMGLPIERLICASNKNDVLTRFIKTGVYDRNREFYRTLSPSMDILISSNVERLLYYLSDCDCDKVKAYMKSLNETGRYELAGAELEKLQERFAAGSCDDDATRRTIAEVWRESGVLIDTHTAVGVRVLRDIGHERPCVIASTASAFKFADGVLPALGDDSGATGFEAIDRLATITGEPVPEPLAGLRGKTLRFDEVIETFDMEDEALQFCDRYDYSF